MVAVKKNRTEPILDDDNLLRRVPFMDPNYIRDDGTLTSFAFSLKKGEEGVSVNVERLTTYKDAILDRSRFRIYFLTARVPRSVGLECIHNPQPNNYSHALIKGKFSNSVRRQLASAARRFEEQPSFQ